MPAWYPDDPSSFVFFHDEEAPRVVDDADILTYEEEEAIEERITGIREAFQRDIVVFTDTSTHGLERAVYCADFYDFNGYGYGDEREGFCLFICMDPESRGFWTCSTGTVSRGLQTREAAEDLDDKLYAFLVKGDYGGGILDWLDNMETLYSKVPDISRGLPLDEEEEEEDIPRFHDPSAPRVYDPCGLFSKSEIEALTEKALDISKTYDTDIVIVTGTVPEGTYTYDYFDSYYKANGYGFGDDYRGAMLALEPYSNLTFQWINFYGETDYRCTALAYERLLRNISRCAEDGNNYKAADRFLDDVDHLLKTGRVPLMIWDYAKAGGIASLIGALISWISLLIASAKMKTPRLQKHANDSYVPDSFRSAAVRDDYVGTTTTRTYRPERESYDSDYSDSYSGSSGAEHSGSGRDF